MKQISSNFDKIGLNPEILSNLVALGYLEMTPIQEKGIPVILENRDFIGQANTGSGKTAAFALGILARLDLSHLMPQALIVVPTRELADQVSNEIRRLARFSNRIKVLTLSGGSKERHKLKSLKQGAHIVVGTPGRLKKLLEKKILSAYNIHMLVLDEADRLLEMGFMDEITAIASFTRRDRQTMLFSATFPHGIKSLSESLMKDAVQVTIDSQHEMNDVEQIFVKVSEDKESSLWKILGKYKPESCLIFCQSKEQCKLVTDLLRKKKISSMTLHSDIEHQDRTLTLIKFSNKSCRVLVATDLASRGLDVKNVSAVINFDLPRQPELYIHRIGRTARAGQQGIALSIFLPVERDIVTSIGEYLNISPEIVKDEEIESVKSLSLKPIMSTIYISGGKKDNIRAGDILGALTKDAGLKGAEVGKIDVLDVNSYASIFHTKTDEAVKCLNQGKIKGKKFKVGLA